MRISSNSKQVVYTVTNLTRDDIYDMEWVRLCLSLTSDDARCHIIISVDFSNIFYIIWGKLTESMESSDKFIKYWSHSGVIMDPYVMQKYYQLISKHLYPAALKER